MTCVPVVVDRMLYHRVDALSNRGVGTVSPFTTGTQDIVSPPYFQILTPISPGISKYGHFGYYSN